MPWPPRKIGQAFPSLPSSHCPSHYKTGCSKSRAQYHGGKLPGCDNSPSQVAAWRSPNPRVGECWYRQQCWIRSMTSSHQKWRSQNRPAIDDSCAVLGPQVLDLHSATLSRGWVEKKWQRPFKIFLCYETWLLPGNSSIPTNTRQIPVQIMRMINILA